MIHILALKSLLHSKAFLGVVSFVFTGLALDMAFLGNMIVAVVVALIGATPPTVAIILYLYGLARAVML